MEIDMVLAIEILLLICVFVFVSSFRKVDKRLAELEDWTTRAKNLDVSEELEFRLNKLENVVAQYREDCVEKAKEAKFNNDELSDALDCLTSKVENIENAS